MYTVELITFQRLPFAKNTTFWSSLQKSNRTNINLNNTILTPIPMSWSCKKCTFLNSPSSLSVCQVCLSSNLEQEQEQEEQSKWSCKACTFLNIYTNQSCEICGTRNHEEEEEAIPKWSCKKCFFWNTYSNHSCETCGTRNHVSCFDDLVGTGFGEEFYSSVGSSFFPLKACKRKIGEFFDDGDQGFEWRGLSDAKAFNVGGGGETDGAKLGGFKDLGSSSKEVTVVKDDNHSAASLTSFKVLTYNVWYREDVEGQNRMKAIGDLIQLHSPEMICFQEVTPSIFELLEQSSWWKAYHCSISKDWAGLRLYFCMVLSKLPVKSFGRKPFKNSIMGRELCIAEVEVGGNKTVVIANTHLESPSPAPPTWDQMYSKERAVQANEGMDFLKKYPNVILAGDMNWNDKLDGQFPLQDGWIDAWAELKPGDDGWTYDTKSNEMLRGNRSLQMRLDRFICSLRDFKISGIEMIGKEEISGLKYIKEKRGRRGLKKLELPVLPSDHYGLLLTVSER